MKNLIVVTAFLAVALLTLGAHVASSRDDVWTPEQVAQLRSLSLSSLGPLPSDPSNRVADDPRAVALGQRLFFDARLSSNGKISCATAIDAPEQERAFKVPSLRNADRAPYMHAGQLASLEDVLAHDNNAPVAPSGHSELKSLGLNATEVRQLVAFLRTLSGRTTAGAL